MRKNEGVTLIELLVVLVVLAILMGLAAPGLRSLLVRWAADTAAASLVDDSFYQVNLWAGFRFPRQRGEISIGVLNLNGADYRLNPLTPYSELPRERVFAARLLFNF